MNRHLLRLQLLLGLAFLAGLLGGCSPGDRLPCPGPTEEMVLGPEEGRVAITLQNDTCMSVCVLSVAPDHCDDMTYAADWLRDHPLHSGESTTLYLPPGKYAAWMEYCTEEYFVMEHLKVEADDTWTLSGEDPANTPPCGASLTVVNNSDVPICSVRMGITESVYTGWNWIGAEHIPVGESQTFMLKPDTYFVRAEACDGTWLRDEVDVPLSGHQTWTVP
jgi:hypothetical protein